MKAAVITAPEAKEGGSGKGGRGMLEPGMKVDRHLIGWGRKRHLPCVVARLIGHACNPCFLVCARRTDFFGHFNAIFPGPGCCGAVAAGTACRRSSAV